MCVFFVFVQCGPFVDSSHPMVSGGDVLVSDQEGSLCPLTFAEVFELKRELPPCTAPARVRRVHGVSSLPCLRVCAVVQLLEAYLGADYAASATLTVVVVPSTDDVLGFPCYPQPPYADKLFAALPDSIRKVCVY